MQVRVIKPGNDAAALEIDDLRARTAQGHRLGIGADRDKTAFTDGHGTGLRIVAVDGVELTIEQDQIGVHHVSLGAQRTGELRDRVSA